MIYSFFRTLGLHLRFLAMPVASALDALQNNLLPAFDNPERTASGRGLVRLEGERVHCSLSHGGHLREVHHGWETSNRGICAPSSERVIRK